MESKAESEPMQSEVRNDSIIPRSGSKASGRDGSRRRDFLPVAPRKAMEQDNSSAFEVLKDDKSDNLSSHERQILERQLSIPSVKVSYSMLYRYATKIDFLIVVASVGCAMASGAVMPLMTVNSPFPILVEAPQLTSVDRLCSAN